MRALARETEAKWVAVLWGGFLFALLAPANAIFCFYLFQEPLAQPIWLWALAVLAYGVGGWAAGRRVPAQPFLYGFLAGAAAVIVVSIAIMSIFREPLAVLLFLAPSAGGIFLAGVGGWFGAICAPRDGSATIEHERFTAAPFHR